MMFRNIFIVAWRVMLRRKVFSLINILGLAVAMAFSLLILLWIREEWQVDQFHANGNRIYRVLQTQFYEDGKVSCSDRTTTQLASALKAEMPEVEKAAMMTQPDLYTLKVNNKVSHEPGGYASADFFQIFSFPFIAGDPERCLAAIDQIVISETLSKKYFGNDDALGKAIRVDNQKDFFVSAVFADIPLNSSLHFDFLLSPEGYLEAPWATDWGAVGDKTYLLLQEDASARSLDSKIKNFMKQKLPDTKDQLSLQLFSKSYLYSNFEGGRQAGGRIEYVRLFSLIAILILLVACINFMNLATAQSVKRSREVGVRKVVGASRGLLIKQFMGEAMLTALMAFCIALLAVEMVLPLFSILTERVLHVPYSDPLFVLTLFGLTIVTGLASGIYPALFLSSLQPAKILKGSWKITPGAIDFRSILVVFQFSLSMIFIVATMVVYQQLRYIQQKDLGVDRENIIYQVFEGGLVRNFEAFKNELSHAAGIQSVTYSNQPMLGIQYPSTWVEWPGKSREVVFSFAGVSYDYCKTMKIRLVEGRDFAPEFGDDTLNVLLNEEAVKQMGLVNPLGYEITTRRDIERKGKVIGVMKDFHLQSLRAPIEPLYLFLDNAPGFGFISVRTIPGMTKVAINSMEVINKKFNPEFPFGYTFAEEAFKESYRSERLLSGFSRAFAGLTIFISCLGVFGLAAFSAEQRTKEIGIRKILGASVASILKLISWDFMVLIAVAFGIAAPIAWYSMNKWLLHYAYRIDLSWWLIVLAGFFSLLITGITAGTQALKVASGNPVEALKTE